MGEKCDAQEDHKLNSPNMQAVEVNLATGGSRISVADVYPAPG